MMNKLLSLIDLKFQSISQFFIQTLLFSVLVLSAPQIFAAPMDKDFDHYNTNFPLDGAHKRTRCDSCHKRGIFKGTPTTCISCHGANSKIASSTMSATHVRVSGPCDTCHTQKAWQAVRMDHSAVSGMCKSCHGVMKGVTGKNSGHMVTSQDCEKCHNTRAWLPAKFGHGPETTNCVRCHNGTTATGKNAGHMLVMLNECDACHRGYANFRTINKPMPHDGFVSTNCRSCHEGQVKNADSMLNATRVRGHSHVDPGSINDCTICHKSGYRSWDGGTNKAVPASGNAPHHGGHFVDPLGCNNAGCHTEPAFHTLSMNTADIKTSCSDCHASKPAIMIHDAARVAQCKVCHTPQSGAPGGATKVTASHSSFMNNASNSRCDDCHKTPTSRKAPPGSFNQFLTRMEHASFNIQRCGYCHAPGKTKANAPTIGNITAHAGMTSSTACGTCHDISPTKFVSNVDAGSIHAASTAKQCGVCHGSATTYPKSGKKLGTGIGRHKDFASDGSNCRSCHTTERYKDRFDHGLAINRTNCVACHVSGTTYPLGRRKQQMRGRGHEGGGWAQCNNGPGCHTSNGGGSWGAGV